MGGLAVTLAALISLSAPQDTPDPFNLLPSQTIIENDPFKLFPTYQDEHKKLKTNQELANILYQKLEEKDLLALLFEKYGDRKEIGTDKDTGEPIYEMRKGFYVGKNLPSEEKYLLFRADDRKKGKTVEFLTFNGFENLDSIFIKNVVKGSTNKRIKVSLEDQDALKLYQRMLNSSIKYLDGAIKRHPAVPLATYEKFIEDKEFVSALENLIIKTSI